MRSPSKKWNSGCSSFSSTSTSYSSCASSSCDYTGGTVGKLCPDGDVFAIVDKNHQLQDVRLRIDAGSHVLYWLSTFPERQNIVFYLFLDEIVDTRVRIDENGCSLLVVVNCDYTNFEFFNFYHADAETIRAWAKCLFSLSQSLRKSYHNVLHYVKKLATPQIITSSSSQLAVNSYSRSPLKLNHAIKRMALLDPSKTADGFVDDEHAYQLYADRLERPDLLKIFRQLSRSGSQEGLTALDVQVLLNDFQRDPRQNEDLYPRKTIAQCRSFIQRWENNSEAEFLSFEGFCKYLLSEEVSDLNTHDMKLRPADMGSPLSHYYISSSHNTYLLGNQIIAAKAIPGHSEQRCETNTEMYHQTLLAGCRCIELDVWESPSGPVVTHGPIALQKINVVPLVEVCEAIAESGFKTTPYPICLSVENHCGEAQQKIMSQIFKQTFGDMLLADELPDYPLSNPNGYLPPPCAMMHKILIKGSRGDFGAPSNQKERHGGFIQSKLLETVPITIAGTVERFIKADGGQAATGYDVVDEDRLVEIKMSRLHKQETKSQQVDRVAASEMSYVLSDLINYFQTRPRMTADDPFFWMHSGSEEKIDSQINKDSATIISHTRRHILRVYPDINRVCSSNFIPMFFWSAGCQMIALNFQTPGLPMQMHDAFLEQNGSCGYVLKDSALTDSSRKMSVHDSRVLVANRVEITIISAQFLSLLSRSSPKAVRIQVDLYDLPLDTSTNRHATTFKTVDAVDANTIFEETTFVFEKIILPSLALLHIRVVDENRHEIGQRFLPVRHLRSGYRHVILRNRANRPIGPACVFVRFGLGVYIPEYQKQVRRHFMDPLFGAARNKKSSLKFADPIAAKMASRRLSHQSVL